MSFYLDTSGIVPLILQDAHTPAAEEWFAQVRATIFISDFAALEFAAVVSRQARMGRLSAQTGALTLDLFDDWAVRLTRRIKTDLSDMALSESLVRNFDLKLAGPDALHLAMATNHGAELVTFDARLAEAARALGAAVVMPV